MILPHPRKLLLFLLLSLSDLGLTWLLLERSGGVIYEGNPVADWWLHRYGWAGLAAFKVLTVLVVVGLTAVVSRSRPSSGGLILSVACAVLALVVGYSCYLVGRGAAREPESAEMASVRAETAQIDAEWEKSREYSRALQQLSEALADGRCSLCEATAQLGSTRRGQDPAWLDRLHAYLPARTDEECLATGLALHSLLQVRDDPAAAERLAHRLERDLAAQFGVSRRLDYRHLMGMAGLTNDPDPAAPGRAPAPSRNRRASTGEPASASEGEVSRG
jgi:hypothetical protein